MPVSFLIKLAEACNFIKKETPAQVFSCEFRESSKNTFFTEHLRVTASVWDYAKAYLGPFQTSIMDIFSENSYY